MKPFSLSQFETLLDPAIFPYGETDKNTRFSVGAAPYYMAREQVTYELWDKVREWVVNGEHGEGAGLYKIGKGKMGGYGGYQAPWCSVVYYQDSQPFWDGLGTKSFVNFSVTNANGGFRLPSSMEWEFAARLIGNTKPTEGSLKDDAIFVNSSKLWFTPANYASGAIYPITDSEVTKDVAWYDANSQHMTASCREEKG